MTEKIEQIERLLREEVLPSIRRSQGYRGEFGVTPGQDEFVIKNEYRTDGYEVHLLFMDTDPLDLQVTLPEDREAHWAGILEDAIARTMQSEGLWRDEM